MKSYKAHISYFFLLVSLFLVSGHAFAASQAQLTSTTKKDASYSDTSSKQQFFEEVSEITISFQQTEKPTYPFFLFYQTVENYSVTQQASEVVVASLPQRDVRKQLAQQLFPFHFFW